MTNDGSHWLQDNPKHFREYHFRGYLKDMGRWQIVPVIDLSWKGGPTVQWTGHRDRNGVKIYEGDIVEHEIKGREVVKFGEIINRDGRIAGWGYDLDDETKVIVLGNVFQYPELISEENNKHE